MYGKFKKYLFVSLIAFLTMMLVAAPCFSVEIIRGDKAFAGKIQFLQDITAKKNAIIEGYLNRADYSQKFFVDSGSGADVPHYGKTWQKPFATLEYAINKCTASQGDIIIVLPGHNEGITSAAAIDFDIAGITVIGLGNGASQMPTIDFDHADASVAIGADGVTLFNLRFRCSENAITVGLDIEDGADDATVAYCRFGDAETATDEFAIALRTNDASNRARILYNEFSAGAQAAVDAIAFVKDTDETWVIGNVITGTYSTAPILGSTTASTNLLIDSNFFFTGGSADTFNLVAASTGIVSNNYITMNAASAALALDIGNCLSFQNYLIADDDVGGAASAIEAGAFLSVTPTADD